MPSFLVTWMINIDAPNVQEAAEEARKIQMDPKSTAVFVILNRDTKVVTKYDLEVQQEI